MVDVWCHLIINASLSFIYYYESNFSSVVWCHKEGESWQAKVSNEGERDSRSLEMMMQR